MTQIITTSFKSIDLVYDFDSDVKPYLHDEQRVYKGNDCVYRALSVQSKFPEANLELRFGIPFFRGDGSKTDSYQVGDYYRPYVWHAWVEDEGAVYDSLDCLAAAGHIIAPETVCIVTDNPTFSGIKNTWNRIKAIEEYCKKIILTMKKRGECPDVIYFEGLGFNVADAIDDRGNVHSMNVVMDWDVFDDFVDNVIFKSPGVIVPQQGTLEEFYAATGPNQPV